MKKNVVTTYTCDHCDLESDDEMCMFKHELECKQKREFRLSKQMTIGQIIKALEKMPQDLPIKFHGCDLDGKYPSRPFSYRGSYNELAVSYSDEKMLVKDFFHLMKWSENSSFTGYKGGSYDMRSSTFVWIDNYGDCNRIAFNSLHLKDDCVIIQALKVE